MKEILLVEPFYSGSHKVLIDWLKNALDNKFGEDKICLMTMKGKKWHWRARTSALYLAQNIPFDHSFRVIFATSVLNLTELIGMREDLKMVKKIIYFHENQLNYPVREYKDRDFQYGYNEITSCLVADLVVFNSCFNKESFLSSIKKHFDIMPDYKPKNLREKIEPKTSVLYFPMPEQKIKNTKNNDVLRIVWPHRWEHDKNPVDFLNIMCRLAQNNMDFELSMIGEQFTNQDTFQDKKQQLGNHVINWGFIESKDKYIEILSNSHIAVSTANHEFFGVSMLEAVQNGCYPLCPDRLSYPELYPEICLYKNYEDLYNKLVNFCHNFKDIDLNLDLYKFSDVCLLPKYMQLFD